MTKRSRKDNGGDNTPLVPLVRTRKSVAVAKYGLTELAKQINKAYDSLLMTSAERAIRVGELLLAAKERVPHGEWQDWVRANTRVTPASARGYMHLARQPEAKRKQICVLGLRQALDATVERLAEPGAPPMAELEVRPDKKLEPATVQLKVHHEVRPPTKVLVPVYNLGTVKHPEAPRVREVPVKVTTVTQRIAAPYYVHDPEPKPAPDPTLEPPLHLVPEVPEAPECRAFGESRLLYAWREATLDEQHELVMKHADEIRRILGMN
jgi:hypothetical protein